MLYSKDLYIFLDMDGVLSTHSWNGLFYKLYIKSTPSSELDPRCVGLLNRLCDLLNPKVVMISTWKHGSTVEELRKELRECGCNFNLHDKTEDIYNRPQEITDYINKHGIKDYVVLDDEAYDFEHKENSIQTLYEDGFTIHEFKEIMNMIGVFAEARRKFRERK